MAEYHTGDGLLEVARERRVTYSRLSASEHGASSCHQAR